MRERSTNLRLWVMGKFSFLDTSLFDQGLTYVDIIPQASWRLGVHQGAAADYGSPFRTQNKCAHTIRHQHFSVSGGATLHKTRALSLRARTWARSPTRIESSKNP